MHSRTFSWIPWFLAVMISVGVGVAAYNAGMSRGLAVNPAVAAAATAAQPAVPGGAVVAVPAWGPWGWHYGHPFGFGFGFFPLFFLVFFWFVIARAFFWRGGWHRYGGPPPAWSDRFDQWHRDAHERMNRSSEPTRL